MRIGGAYLTAEAAILAGLVVVRCEAARMGGLEPPACSWEAWPAVTKMGAFATDGLKDPGAWFFASL